MTTMAEFTASDVAKLREMTGVGMMECKKALVEANGNLEAAVEILRKKGKAGADTKSQKEAREGLIVAHIAAGGKLGVLAEINCQTDFVARNDDFKAFADEVAKAYAANPNVDLESRRTEMVAKIGENIRLARNSRLEVSGAGQVAAYIHTGAKVGVLVEVGCSKDDTTTKDEFKQLVKDITLQIAAAHPIAVNRDQVDPKIVEKEKEIAAEQFKNKPAQAIAKIVEGKLNSYFQTVCLVDQGFVKDPEKTIATYIGEVGKKLGDEITVRRFLRFQVGEAVAS
jgi:elongation factor Ts